jgi:hypothetical protein
MKHKVMVPANEWLMIDEEGNGFSSRRGKAYAMLIDKYGYVRYTTSVGGDSRSCFAHRVVALAFIDNIDNKPTVNHINGIKTDNRLENLEWATLSEQQLHAFEIGLKPNHVRGVDSNFNVHTEEVIRDICEMIESGYRNRAIIDKYPHMDVKLPSDIRNKKSWTHISKEYNIFIQRRGRLSEDTVRWICRHIELGTKLVNILELCNNPVVNKSVISHIKLKKVYKDIVNDYNF